MHLLMCVHRHTCVPMYMYMCMSWESNLGVRFGSKCLYQLSQFSSSLGRILNSLSNGVFDLKYHKTMYVYITLLFHS